MSNEKWTAENIADQKGRVAIVTGSSSGIGFEAARVLANKHAQIVIAVRNLDKGKKAAEKILAQNKAADVRVMELDLADLNSVAKFAENFKKAYSRLDLLINNAGVMIPPFSKTADGFELQFGTNHLGHFALTAQLLEVLINTKDARIVNVSSGAHKAGKLDFDDLAWEKRSYSAWRAYGDSKLANLYFTYELDRKLKENNLELITTAAHPGWTATELQRHTGLVEFLNGIFAMDVSQGALPTLRAATEDGLKGAEYFGPDGFMEMRGFPVRVPSNELSKDAGIAKRLWEVSENLTGVKFDFHRKAQSAVQ
jgi:NAD(P)-dependent dehydrogenase (short-subunit alcohol dehydrogenase family)